MPIDYSNYPKNWKTEIRPRILRRAGQRCERCRVKNYDTGYRGKDGKFYSSSLIMAALEYKNYDYFEHELSHIDLDKKPLKIVLTLAHLDHGLHDHSDENLQALCQRCHFLLDREQHMRNSRKTRNAKKGLVDMFEEVPSC